MGGQIRAIRTTRGYTQAELGARAGLSGKFIGEIERGGNTSIENLFKVAEALGVDVATFFERPSGRSSGRTLTSTELDQLGDAVDTLADIFRRRGKTPGVRR